MALDNLFSPIMIGNVKVPNHRAMAPMNLGPKMYTDNEVWPKKTIRYYEERAIGGIGLIITQFVRVYDKLASYPIAGLYEDSSIPAHAELVKRIHKYDTKIFHQIALMGGKDYTRAGEAQNAIIYATDLYGANFSLAELNGDDLYIVWKKDGQYLSPSGDGVLKIVANNGPTNKWVKNPVVFDFISEYKDRVEAKDRPDQRFD